MKLVPDMPEIFWITFGSELGEWYIHGDSHRRREWGENLLEIVPIARRVAQGAIVRWRIDFDGSGTIRDRSSSVIRPAPRRPDMLP